jgi:predicted dehydrogenase
MLRWAIIGTSFISETMAKAIATSDGSRAEAVFGRDAGRLSDFADRHGIAKRYTDYGLLLDDPDIDVVYIGLPSNIHHEAVIKAALKGKAILSEKSLTASMADAGALAQAVRSADVFFLEGLMYLCHPLMEKVGEIIRSGRLGTIRSVSGSYAADIWKLVNPLGNGTIFNLGCYPVSLLQYVVQTAFGPEVFTDRVTGGSGNVSDHDGNICDAALLVRFSNGVLATVQSTDSYGMSFDFAIYGDRGVLRFRTNPWLPVAGENILEIQHYDREPETIVVTSPFDSFQHQVMRVEECLRHGRTAAPRPSPRLSDSLEIMALLTTWEEHCRAIPSRVL